MAVVQQMGSTNIYASVLGVRFADGTTQLTAAAGGFSPSDGSTFVADASGIALADPFGGLIHTNATDTGFSAGGSGGGFGQFFNGTVWVTFMGDGNGNGLFLGPLFTDQQINLTNASSHAGMINTIGDTNFLYGNPLFLGVAGGVGITISPAGISLNGIGLSLTPPTAGQVLTASSPTAAGWVNPFPITNEGSTISLDATGISMTDPFGNVFSMDAHQVGFSSPGGGFNMLFNGTDWISITADSSGNALFLGAAFPGQQINLTNPPGNAGLMVFTGDTTSILGNPLFLGVNGGLGITIDPTGISLNGIKLSLTPPTAGQVLEASSPTAAEWVTPAGGGSLNYKVVRSAPTAFTQGGIVGPIVLSFATPFADNNYTLSVTVEGDEAAPGTPTLTQYPSVGISYIVRQAGGAGVTVWVSNNDSIAHTGVISVVAIHD